MTNEPLLQAKGITVSIGGKRICQELDLEVRAGECWAVLGRNGVGKTTLIHSLAGLRGIEAGDVLLNGRSIYGLPRRAVAREIGVMLQVSDTVFPQQVREAVMEGRHPHLHRFHWESPEDQMIADKALAELGIESFADRWVQTLSGGERRLVDAATLFVQDPSVFLLDEPNSHLDLCQQLSLLDRLLLRVRNTGRAALVILHDVNLASRYCSHALILFGDGASAAGPTQVVLTEESIKRAYRHPVQRLAGVRGEAFFLPG